MLWNQHKFIAFSIFSCNILIIICKVLIITVIFNETTNICQIMSKSYNILPTIASFFMSSSGKTEACGNSRTSSSSCFIAGDTHIKIIFSYAVVSNKNAILYFWDDVHFLKHYPIKLPQNCFDLFRCTNQTGIQISKFSFALDNQRNSFKVFVNCRCEFMMQYFSIILQLTWFFERMLLSIGIINLKIESLIA